MVGQRVINILQKEGVLSKKEAQKKLRDFEKQKTGNVLDFYEEIAQGDTKQLTPILREQYQIPVLELDEITVDVNTANILPRDICYEHNIVPFFSDATRIFVAMADAENTDLIAFIGKYTNRQVVPYLSRVADIQTTLRTLFEESNEALQSQILGLIERARAMTELVNTEDREAPVVELLERLFTFSLKSRASDLHIEPSDKDVVLRLRIDGILHEAFHIPSELLPAVIGRLKILSGLRIDEHLRPLDGRFTYTKNGMNVAIRISIVPTLYGPKAALRFLDTKSVQKDLTTIGLSEPDLKKIRESIAGSNGIILVTGPTGSGKTTTLYAILNALQTREKNISTIEDPIEYHVPGVNQIQVNPEAGLTFSNGLRSILRQDPDVIMVGEIRDRETAEIAINAALTGHLVLATLHTKSAAAAIPRLIDMGIEPYLLASTLRAVVGQRLARTVCSACAKDTIANELPHALSSEKLSNVTFKEGAGCAACHNTGFTGRMGIFETLVVDEALHDHIMKKTNATALENHAKEKGMTTIAQDGIQKILHGVTTPAELARILL